MTDRRSQRERMAAGDWYCCLDDELDALRQAARRAVHAHNTLHPDTRGAMAPDLARLIRAGRDTFIEAPFHCAYGFNITRGKNVYLNAGCTILDTGPVTIGDGTMLGPAVQIYCAQHAREIDRRAQGLEIALPVAVGRDVWIGGAAIIMPGVTIGDGAIVGAGSVVLQDVAPGATVVGNPARPLG